MYQQYFETTVMIQIVPIGIQCDGVGGKFAGNLGVTEL